MPHTTHYIIAADYVNAISIYKSLLALKVNGEITFIDESGRNMVGKIYPEVDVLQDITNEEKLIQYLLSFDQKDKKYLFLTHEKYHTILWENKELLNENNVVFHIGNKHPDTILHKTQFLELVRSKTDVPVPYSFSADEIDTLDYPVFVKPKSSFIEGSKASLEKAVIQNSSQLKDYLHHAKMQHVDSSDIEIQELLSTKTRDNVSISGWYEKGFHQFYQTQKILQHPPKRGNGDVVKLMPLNFVLEQQVLQLMSVLDFQGPFEAEFVKERNGEKYKLIEINPRFWMQHGLIEQLSGHLLVARYIDVEPIQPITNYQYWMYTAIVPIQLAKCRFKYLCYIFRKDVYKPLSFRQAWRFLWKYLVQKIEK